MRCADATRGAATRGARLLRDKGGALDAAYNSAVERLEAYASSPPASARTEAQLVEEHTVLVASGRVP